MDVGRSSSNGAPFTQSRAFLKMRGKSENIRGFDVADLPPAKNIGSAEVPAMCDPVSERENLVGAQLTDDDVLVRGRIEIQHQSLHSPLHFVDAKIDSGEGVEYILLASYAGHGASRK